ncbi:MAG: hypothetical protein R3A13_06190 [Bdellovibrionota bacterium]
MAFRDFNKNSHGIAILEFVFSILIVLSIVLGGAVIWEKMTSIRELQEFVDTSLASVNARPFKLENSSGELSLVLNQAEIELSLATAIEEIKTRLDEVKLSHGDYADQFKYFIEAGYSVLNIDSIDGSPQGLVTTPFSYHTTYGTNSIASNVQSSESLAAKIQSFSTKTLDSGQSLYAIPGRNLSSSAINDRYLDATVLISARAIIDRGNSFIGSLFEYLGLDGTNAYSQVVVLRNEVK